jgi:hypothetical protein
MVPKGDQYSPFVALKKTPATGSPRLYSLAHVVMLKRIREVGGGGKKGAVGCSNRSSVYRCVPMIGVGSKYDASTVPPLDIAAFPPLTYLLSMRRHLNCAL